MLVGTPTGVDGDHHFPNSIQSAITDIGTAGIVAIKGEIFGERNTERDFPAHRQPAEVFSIDESTGQRRKVPSRSAGVKRVWPRIVEINGYLKTEVITVDPLSVQCFGNLRELVGQRSFRNASRSSLRSVSHSCRLTKGFYDTALERSKRCLNYGRCSKAVGPNPKIQGMPKARRA